MTDFDNTDRYDWLRPVGIAATEADILAHGLQDPLTLLYDLKAGDYYIAFDEERASGMAADMAEDEAAAEGLDALGLSEKDTADLDWADCSTGEQKVGRILVGAEEELTSFDVADRTGFSDGMARGTLRKFHEAGWVTRSGSQNEGYRYEPTRTLEAAVEEADAQE